MTNCLQLEHLAKCCQFWQAKFMVCWLFATYSQYLCWLHPYRSQSTPERLAYHWGPPLCVVSFLSFLRLLPFLVWHIYSSITSETLSKQLRLQCHYIILPFSFPQTLPCTSLPTLSQFITSFTLIVVMHITHSWMYKYNLLDPDNVVVYILFQTRLTIRSWITK